MSITITASVNNPAAETEIRNWLVADYGMDPQATDAQASAMLSTVARDVLRNLFKQRRRAAALDLGQSAAIDRLETLAARIT